MLKDKNILITGSAKGIGLATARLAKSYGANIIVHDKIESPELDAIAKEYAKNGIRVNSISPGGVNTDTAKSWDEETRKRNSDVLLGRIAEPEEIAEAICFFLSDKSSYATGQDFLFDGGYVIGK